MSVRKWKAVALLSVGTPAGAHVASWTHNWNAHTKPKSDPRYLPGGNLPAGRTIRGSYRITGNDQIATSDLGSTSISFGFELAAAPTPNFRPAGSAPTANCAGSATNPQAAPGHLCVYESQSSNRGSVVLFTGTTGAFPAASKWGAGVWLIPAAAGNAYSYGTWAVTAPNGTSPSRVAPGASTGATAGG